MAENNDDPIDLDALADTLFGNPEPDVEAQVEETPAEPGGESEAQATQVAPVLDQNILAQAVQMELARMAGEQERQARLGNIQKLLTEGSDEEAGAYLKAQYAQAQLRSQFGNQAISDYSSQILDTLLPDDYVAQLSPEDRQTLAVMAEQSATDAEYFVKVADFRNGKTQAQRDEEEFNKRVQEAVKAQLNQSRGQQFKQNSPSNVPASKAGSSESYDTDSLWSAAFEEISKY